MLRTDDFVPHLVAAAGCVTVFEDFVVKCEALPAPELFYAIVDGDFADPLFPGRG